MLLVVLVLLLVVLLLVPSSSFAVPFEGGKFSDSEHQIYSNEITCFVVFLVILRAVVTRCQFPTYHVAFSILGMESS